MIWLIPIGDSAKALMLNEMSEIRAREMFGLVIAVVYSYLMSARKCDFLPFVSLT